MATADVADKKPILKVVVRKRRMVVRGDGRVQASLRSRDEVEEIKMHTLPEEVSILGHTEYLGELRRYSASGGEIYDYTFMVSKDTVSDLTTPMSSVWYESRLNER